MSYKFITELTVTSVKKLSREIDTLVLHAVEITVKITKQKSVNMIQNIINLRFNSHLSSNNLSLRIYKNLKSFVVFVIVSQSKEHYILAQSLWQDTFVKVVYSTFPMFIIFILLVKKNEKSF